MKSKSKLRGKIEERKKNCLRTLLNESNYER